MPDAPNLVLAGMPGSGKSTVGQILAERWGWTFLDLDTEVTDLAGTNIGTIFEHDGEARFRQLERQAVQGLGRLTRHVIATGGWTVGDPDSLAELQRLGPTVLLTAPPTTLFHRIRAHHNGEERPGTTGLDPLKTRWRERRAVYLSLPWRVETDGRPPEDVADRVEALIDDDAWTDALEPRAIPILGLEPAHRALVGRGLLDRIGTLIDAEVPTHRVALVTDTNVSPLYADRVSKRLAAAGIQSTTLAFAPGEPSKRLATASDLYDGFIAADLDRRATIVGLGGGVTTDVAGFAAATYLRGVRLVHVPTSLLAMVDAAVGGKTGVNHPAGKNLIGAFHAPALVVIDPDARRTLPLDELRAGLAEVVKAAVIGDPHLLSHLDRSASKLGQGQGDWVDLIVRAVSVKAAVVAEDPRESDRRQVLNLGHTFAHAIETATNHRWAHGPAVAVGLVAAARLGAELGLTEDHLVERLDRILRDIGLPTRYDGAPPDEVLAAMSTDKKRRGDGLRFIVPVAAGDVQVIDNVPRAAVAAVLRQVSA